MSERQRPGSPTGADSDEATRDAQGRAGGGAEDHTESQSATYTAAVDPRAETPKIPATGAEEIDPGTATAETAAADMRGRERPVVAAESALDKGESLGRYVILDVLGAGGMGVVYTAYDPGLDRKVAIKVMRAKYKGEEGKVRMQREAHALARLSHPNVVAIHDVGTFGDRVFVAMEFVDGVSLRNWLKEGDRRWQEVVSVLVDAGRGLAAAHAAGLTHRDVKPSNVLIDNQGRVRILDFGLARATGSDSENLRDSAAREELLAFGSTDPLETAITRTGAGVGTPAYMAPEQRQGECNPLADQYSFCVSLYEALYRERPTHDSVPTPPESDVPSRIERALLRGLAPRPSDRFPSMDALLEEIDLRPPTRSAKLWIAIAVSMLVVAAAAITLAARAAAKPEPCAGARDLLTGAWDTSTRAEVRAAFRASKRPHAADALRKVEEELDRWSNAWTEMRTEVCVATRVRGDQTEELMELRVQCLDEQRDEARALTRLFARGGDEKVVDNAVEATLALSPLDRCANAVALKATTPLPEDDAQRERATRLHRLLMDASALKKAGKFSEALERVRAVNAEAAEVDYSPLRAQALHLQADLQEETADHKGAEQTLYAAAAAAADARDDYRVAQIWTALSWLLGYKRGEHEAAARFLRVAEAAVARAGKPPVLLAALAERAGSLAYVRGNYDEAEGSYQRALDLMTRALGANHPELTSLLNNLGEVYRRQGKYDQAREKYELALRIREQTLGPHHPDVAVHVNNIGVLLESMGEYEEAMRYFERALAIRERALGPDHPKLAHTLIGLGSILARQKKYRSARDYTQRALEIWRDSLGEAHPNLGYPHHNLGDIYRAEGDCETAITHYRRAAEIFTATIGESHPTLAYPLTGLGECLIDTGKAGSARVTLERALAIREASTVPEAEQAATSFALARALWAAATGRKRALELARRAEKAFERAGQEADLRAVRAWLDKRE